MASRINFIDIYSFCDELDAGVIETLLEDFDISCSIRMLKIPASSHAEPPGCGEASASDTAACNRPPGWRLPEAQGRCGGLGASFEMMIAVEEEKVENALRVINDARRTGVISRYGRFRV